MSVTGLSGADFFQLSNPQISFQQKQNEFKQLGQDLQAGNLSQAQQDFATLTQNAPGGAQNGIGVLAQDFRTLGAALQSGNLSDAQQAFSTVQQDIQQVAAQDGGQGHHGHHRHIEDTNPASSQPSNPISQIFSALGQALQAGNLSDAQKTYATIEQEFQQFGPSSGSGSSASSNLSVNA
jgi:hypothetical protein